MTPALLAGLVLGLLLALLWPGNPASRALISVTDATHSCLRGAA